MCVFVCSSGLLRGNAKPACTAPHPVSVRSYLLKDICFLTLSLSLPTHPFSSPPPYPPLLLSLSLSPTFQLSLSIPLSLSLSFLLSPHLCFKRTNVSCSHRGS